MLVARGKAGPWCHPVGGGGSGLWGLGIRARAAWGRLDHGTRDLVGLLGRGRRWLGAPGNWYRNGDNRKPLNASLSLGMLENF